MGPSTTLRNTSSSQWFSCSRFILDGSTMETNKITTLLLLIFITSSECVQNVYNLTNEVQEVDTHRKSPLVSAAEEVAENQEVGGVDITSVVNNFNNKEPTFNNLLKDLQEKEEEQETNRKNEQSLIINNSKVGSIMSLDHARNEFEAIEGKSGIRLNDTGRIQDSMSAGAVNMVDDAGAQGGEPLGMVDDDSWMTYENAVSLPVRLKPSGDIVPMMKSGARRKKLNACKNTKRKSRRILFCA